MCENKHCDCGFEKWFLDGLVKQIQTQVNEDEQWCRNFIKQAVADKLAEYNQIPCDTCTSKDDCEQDLSSCFIETFYRW